MKIFFQYFISIIILFPIIPFLITFIMFKRNKGTIKSIGIASDITTFILLFSVPLMIRGLWKFHFTWIMLIGLIIIGIIFTYLDWRKKKELEILPLLKKIWRMYFIFLSILFILIWIVGLITSIIEFVYNK